MLLLLLSKYSLKPIWQKHLSRMAYDILHHNVVYFLAHLKFSHSSFSSFFVFKSNGNYETFTSIFIFNKNDVPFVLWLRFALRVFHLIALADDLKCNLKLRAIFVLLVKSAGLYLDVQLNMLLTTIFTKLNWFSKFIFRLRFIFFDRRLLTAKNRLSFLVLALTQKTKISDNASCFKTSLLYFAKSVKCSQELPLIMLSLILFLMRKPFFEPLQCIST